MTQPSAGAAAHVHLAVAGPGPERHLEAPSTCSAMAGTLKGFFLLKIFSSPNLSVLCWASQQALIKD